jgi:hypothetical protein
MVVGWAIVAVVGVSRYMWWCSGLELEVSFAVI